jgi:hypothetical protein
MLIKVAPMPMRPTRCRKITESKPLDFGIPKFKPAKARLSEVALQECARLVDVLLDIELDQMVQDDCLEDERPVAKEWLRPIRYNEASKVALSLVLPRVRKYLTRWTEVINAAEHDDRAHALVALLANDLGLWDSMNHYETPRSEYKDTRYGQRDDEDTDEEDE